VKAPKVAVITRTRSRPRMLVRALGSVQSQSMRDFLWVIVNDGGEPGPVDRIASQAEASGIRTKVIHRSESKGMEAASNAGIRASRSGYIAIHDDDDTWEPEFLAETSRFLDQEAGFVGVVTHALRVTERMSRDSIDRVKSIPHAPVLPAIHIADMARSNLYPPIAFLYRRSLFQALGGYDESMPILGDWDFNLRALLRGDIAVIPKRLANYHVRQSDASADPHYVNSITPQAAAQQVADALYRNRKLREDLAAGQFGLGALLLVGRLQAKPMSAKALGIDLSWLWGGRRERV
jgi:glycosyltransferase involved in cell wall biosynthesis